MATVLATGTPAASRLRGQMNAAAIALGLTSTHITDPSGVDPATTSTARIWFAWARHRCPIPVFRQIVSLGQASVPMTSVVFIRIFDLGQDGIIGIKTGSDASAQGCYLFAAQQNRREGVTVVGAVLTQSGRSSSGPTPPPSTPVTHW